MRAIEHIVQVSGTELAPQGGDHAVGALIVAALGDLQVGIVLGGGQHTAALQLRGVNVTEIINLFALHQLFDGRDDLGIAAGTQDAVHLGHLLEIFLLIPLS